MATETVAPWLPFDALCEVQGYEAAAVAACVRADLIDRAKMHAERWALMARETVRAVAAPTSPVAG